MTEEKPLWEQLEEESDENYILFCAYRDLGPDRTVPKLLAKRGKGNENYTYELSRKWNWVQRCNKWDIHLATLSAESQENSHKGKIDNYRSRNEEFAKDAQQTARIMLAVAKTKLSAAVTKFKGTEGMNEEERAAHIENVPIDRAIGPLVRSAVLVFNSGSMAEAQALGIDQMLNMLEPGDVDEDEE